MPSRVSSTPLRGTWPAPPGSTATCTRGEIPSDRWSGVSSASDAYGTGGRSPYGAPRATFCRFAPHRTIRHEDPVEIRSIAQFLQYWDSVRGRTRRVIACIPPERLEWTHRPGRFTLGDLVRHLA